MPSRFHVVALLVALVAFFSAAPALRAQVPPARHFVTVTATPGAVQVGQPVVVGYSVVNPNVGDDLRGIFIDFGDGSSQQAPTVPPSGTAQHTYSSPGTYTVNVSSVSIGQITGQATTTVVVGPVVRSFLPAPAPAPSPSCSWTGIWDAGPYGTLKLVQNGNQVTGSYAYFGDQPTYSLIQGTVAGTITNNTLLGNWFEPPVYVGQFIGAVSVHDECQLHAVQRALGLSTNAAGHLGWRLERHATDLRGELDGGGPGETFGAPRLRSYGSDDRGRLDDILQLVDP